MKNDFSSVGNLWVRNLLKFLSAMVVAALAVGPGMEAARADLVTQYFNYNTDYQESQVNVIFQGANAGYPLSASTIGFGNASAPAMIFNSSGGAFTWTNSVTLDDLRSNGWVSMTGGDVSVAVYISLGNVLNTTSFESSSAPSFTNTSDPNYQTRWDTYEITYTPVSSDVGNLTAINKYAIPLSIDAYSASVASGPLGNLVTETNPNLLASLTSLANLYSANSSANQGGGGLPANWVVTDANNNFVRIIAPASGGTGVYNSTGSWIGPYPSFNNYSNYLATNSTTTNISGQFREAGTTVTYYYDANLTAVASAATPTASAPQGGDITISGTLTAPSGTTATVSITITADGQLASNAAYTDFNQSNSIYGAAYKGTPGATYLVNGTAVTQGATPVDTSNAFFTALQSALGVSSITDTTALVDQMMHDVYSGLNFGLVGNNLAFDSSTLTNISLYPLLVAAGTAGTSYNDMGSAGWTQLALALTNGDYDVSNVPLFSLLDTNFNQLYNQWARIIYTNSPTVYGFAYSDYLQPVTVASFEDVIPNTTTTYDVSGWIVSILADNQSNWVTPGANGSFDDAANWSNAALPTSTSTVVFPMNYAANALTTVNFGTSQTLYGVVVAPGLNAETNEVKFDLSGHTLTTGVLKIMQDSAATIAGGNVVANAVYVQSPDQTAATTLTLNTALTLADTVAIPSTSYTTQSILVAEAAKLIVGGGAGETGSITLTAGQKFGTMKGSILLGAGSSTASGTVTMTSADFLSVNDTNTQIIIGVDGTGTWTMTNGTAVFQNGFLLALNAGSTGSFSQVGGQVQIDGGAIGFRNGTGSYTLGAGAELLIGTAFTGTGTLNLAGGTINVTPSVETNNTFTVPDTVSTVLATGTTSTVNANTYTVVWDSPISGAGNLVKNGFGAMALGGANTFTGTTAINGGAIIARSGSALGVGTGADVSVGAGATLVADLDSTETLVLGGDLTLTNATVQVKTLDAVNERISVGGDLTATGTNNLVFGDLSQTGDFGIFDVTGLGPDLTTFALKFGNSETVLSGVTLSNLGGTVLATVGSNLSAVGNLISGTAPTLTFITAGDAVGVVGGSTIGTLQLGGSATFAGGAFTLAGGVLDTGDNTATFANTGVTTPGDLTKLGSGTLNVLSQFSVGGSAYLNGGTTAVNGAFLAQNLFVQQDALLKGSGLISGNLFNDGTVAPGNSPGTLTVNGNFTQSSNGTLQIEVADNAFDQLIVSGKASLAGTLQGIAFGGHQFEYGDQVPFLQAGSISGEFDNIVMTNPSKFRGRFIADGGTGILVVAPTSYTLVAENQNQENVAKALDSFIGASGDKDTVSTALDIQTENQYGSAFDQISPAFYQSLTDTVIEQVNAQNQMLAQRLSSVRLGARGFNVIGLDQAALTNDRDGKNVMEAKGEKDIISPTTDTEWSVFVQGNGIFSRVTNVSQVPNYNFNSGGFITGIDYTFGGDKTTTGEGKKAVVTTEHGSTLTLGLYTGYQGTYAKYANGGRTTINSALFGGYASYGNGGFYSNLIVGGSYNGYRASRPIDFSTIDRTARSSPDGGTFSTYLDAGYDFHVGDFTFGPILSGQYTYAGTAPFTESGADSLDLQVSQQNASSLRTNVGGRVAYTWQLTDSITIIPEGRIFWQHEYLDGERTIGASLDGGGGPGFNFETSDPDRDSVFAGVGVSANFGDRWSTYVYYNADFGRQDYVSQMISGGLGWKF